MARPARGDIGEAALDLDSLTDILTCSVGVMILVVLLAVLDAHSASILVSLPSIEDPPEGARRRILLCTNNEVRPFGFDGAVDVLTDGDEINFRSLPGVVEQANASAYTDGYFDYRFEMREWRTFNATRRAVDMVVTPHANATAFTLDELEDAPERFDALLDDYTEGGEFWVAFLVDSDSIAAFREARALVVERGVQTGWDPGDLEFPYTETVLGGDSGGGRGILGTIQ